VEGCRDKWFKCGITQCEGWDTHREENGRKNRLDRMIGCPSP